MNKRTVIALYLLVVVVAAILLAFALSSLRFAKPATSAATTVATQSLVPSAPSRIGDYAYSSTIPFSISEAPNLGTGYLRGTMFSYVYGQNTVVLRFLSYSNSTDASFAYSQATNYTFNSSAVPLSPLPSGYKGIAVDQFGRVVFALSNIYGDNVITISLQQNASNAMTVPEAANFLVYAEQKLLNSTA
ncbi:MAG: hypothetical protein QXT43_02105 [Candidatus Micrarchaeaceae archaeon]